MAAEVDVAGFLDRFILRTRLPTSGSRDAGRRHGRRRTAAWHLVRRRRRRPGRREGRAARRRHRPLGDHGGPARQEEAAAAVRDHRRPSGLPGRGAAACYRRHPGRGRPRRRDGSRRDSADRPADRPLPGPGLGRGDGRGVAAVDGGGRRLAARRPIANSLRAHPRQRRRTGTRPPLPRRRTGAGARPRPERRHDRAPAGQTATFNGDAAHRYRGGGTVHLPPAATT